MKKILLFVIVFSLIFSKSVFAINDWAKEAIGAKGTESKEGKDIKIAIIDTGISGISSNRIAKGKNYVVDGATTADTIGHGTAIAGLVLDIAPQATIIPLVYYSKTEENKIIKADNAKLAEIIKEAVDVFRCRVINISSGTTQNSEELYEAINYAEKNGAVVVSSVGNSNNEKTENIYYPAAYDTVIGVGAIRKDNKVASFSQKNKSVSIIAPGDELTVLKPNGKYTLAYGTSYATAYVSSAVALLLSEKPELIPLQVRQILYNSSKDIGEEGYDTSSGYGLLQINKALSSIHKDEIQNLVNKFILSIGQTRAKVWGEELENDVVPIIRNKRTMLPTRFVAENLGAKVIWDQDKQCVTITKDNTEILIVVGENKATINKEEFVLDSPAFIENKRVYTPVRFMTEKLGATVEWDEYTQKVIITR